MPNQTPLLDLHKILNKSHSWKPHRANQLHTAGNNWAITSSLKLEAASCIRGTHCILDMKNYFYVTACPVWIACYTSNCIENHIFNSVMTLKMSFRTKIEWNWPYFHPPPFAPVTMGKAAINCHCFIMRKIYITIHTCIKNCHILNSCT